MDHQATLDPPPRRDSSAQAALKNLAHVAHDVMTLAGLQFRLFVTDMKELRKGVVVAMTTCIVAIVLALATLPTALIGAGLALSYATELPAFAGMLIVSLIAFILAALLVGLGIYQLKRKEGALERSRAELRRNLAAMRQALASYAKRDEWD
jgi:uncharacterized membrane protein YbhN (UPF0104 family)